MTAPSQQKQRATPQLTEYNPEFFEHEVIAASQALRSYAADPRRNDPRWVRRKQTLIRTSLTSGIRQKAAPPELVADDYEILLQGLKPLGSLLNSELQDTLYGAPLQYALGDIRFTRPFPLSIARFARMKEAFVDTDSVQPAQIAQRAVAARFRIGTGTVENYTQRGVQPRDVRRTGPAQRLLASLYLDLAATDSAAIRNDVFEALCESEYSPFRLYHLVVRAQAIVDPLVDDISHIDSNVIRELQEAAVKDRATR